MPEPITPTAPAEPYNRDAIYDEDGPFNPGFVNEAVRTLMRALPLDSNEATAWCQRRMCSALTALAALHPRDEIEIMIGVQAIAAYHAAAACWYVGMNLRRPNGDSTRHITAAANAARAFDAMLRSLERRQARPLAVPAGRPPAKSWAGHPNPADIVLKFEDRCRDTAGTPQPGDTPEPDIVFSEEDIAVAAAVIEQDRIDRENEGLDIANTEGILPGGGMIVMENPTPQQMAYMGRRLALMYKREIEENRRKGITKYPRIRGIRPGDLIP